VATRTKPKRKRTRARARLLERLLGEALWPLVLELEGFLVHHDLAVDDLDHRPRAAAAAAVAVRAVAVRAAAARAAADGGREREVALGAARTNATV